MKKSEGREGERKGRGRRKERVIFEITSGYTKKVGVESKKRDVYQYIESPHLNILGMQMLIQNHP